MHAGGRHAQPRVLCGRVPAGGWQLADGKVPGPGAAVWVGGGTSRLSLPRVCFHGPPGAWSQGPVTALRPACMRGVALHAGGGITGDQPPSLAVGRPVAQDGPPLTWAGSRHSVADTPSFIWVSVAPLCSWMICRPTTPAAWRDRSARGSRSAGRCCWYLCQGRLPGSKPPMLELAPLLLALPPARQRPARGRGVPEAAPSGHGRARMRRRQHRRGSRGSRTMACQSACSCPMPPE